MKIKEWLDFNKNFSISYRIDIYKVIDEDEAYFQIGKTAKDFLYAEICDIDTDDDRIKIYIK